MSALAPLLHELRVALGASAPSGVAATGVEGVSFFWNEGPIPRAPLLYDSGLVLVGQGGKVGYLGGRRVEYGADTCLVLGVPVPFECEVHATPEEPLLGIRIDIEPTVLHGLVARVGNQLRPDGDRRRPTFGVDSLPIEGALLTATTRLVASLHDPIDRQIIAPTAVEEIVYRVLRNEQGGVLSALTRHHTSYANIARTLQWIHENYQASLAVADLAREAAMSVSTFHRAFKEVTGETPLQYLKKLRLLKAKARLVFDGLRVAEAAYSVGYASPSQFSREFKRYFDVPPSEAQSLPYSDAP